MKIIGKIEPKVIYLLPSLQSSLEVSLPSLQVDLNISAPVLSSFLISESPTDHRKLGADRIHGALTRASLLPHSVMRCISQKTRSQPTAS